MAFKCRWRKRSCFVHSLFWRETQGRNGPSRSEGWPTCIGVLLPLMKRAHGRDVIDAKGRLVSRMVLRTTERVESMWRG